MPLAEAPLIKPKKLYLIAGEPSGDQLGANLITALRENCTEQRKPMPDLYGVGGERMADLGFKSLFSINDLAVMGLLEVLPHIRRLKRRLQETVDDIIAHQPDVVVTIDSPGFTYRVASQIREKMGKSIPLVHYVAPTVWAWKPERAAKMARLYDQLLVLLPFEPPYFEKEGLECHFVGHPIAETVQISQQDREAYRESKLHEEGGHILLLLPGSRKGEVKKLLPVFKETVAILSQKMDKPLALVLPTVSTVADLVAEKTRSWPWPVHIVRDSQEKTLAFQSSDVALAASGTVALETAAAALPTVVGYRLNPITYLMVRRMVQVQWVSLVNLLLQKEVIPECLQKDCQPEILADHLFKLLKDPSVSEAQKASFADAMALLHPETGPVGQAAAKALRKWL